MAAISIIIVEDDISTADYLQLIMEERGIEVLAICNNYDDAKKKIDSLNPDVLILDIELEGEKTGIDIAREINKKIPVVFVTSYSDNEVIEQVKDIGPFAFLTKPFKEKDVIIAVELAVFSASGKLADLTDKMAIFEDSLFVRSNNLYIRLKFKEIRWLKAERNYTEIQTTDKRYLVRNVLKEVERQFPDDIFFRIHRSYVVNLNFITAINHQVVHLDDAQVPISRQVQSWLLSKIKLLS